MAVTCFRCQETGHIAADCPYDELIDNRPSWCGICDSRTRLLAIPGDKLVRCPDCHPTPRKPLAQHKRCLGCKQVIHSWDTAPCGQHSSPAAVNRRPEREHIEEIVRSNS